MIVELLERGKENRVSSRSLRERTGLSVRELHNVISQERKEGNIILSCRDSGGGYWLPANKKEVESFIVTMEKEAKSTMFILKNAKKYIKKIDGQQELNL